MSTPKELNFFDTNPVVNSYALTLGDVRKQSPIWDRNLYVSLCIEVLLADQHGTEAIIVVRIAIRIIERKRTRIVAIAVITTAFEERIRRIRKVRVVAV